MLTPSSTQTIEQPEKKSFQAVRFPTLDQLADLADKTTELKAWRLQAEARRKKLQAARGEVPSFRPGAR